MTSLRTQLDESPPSASVANAGPVQMRIAQIGEELATSITRVLDALPGSPLRPSDLAKTLSIDAMLSSRVLKATQAGDALAVAHLMPGPEPLRRVLKAAERKNVDPKLVRAAAGTVDEFEKLIELEGGDRAGLDAMISAYLPEAREKYELGSKQSIYRGFSQIRGVAVECDVTAFFSHPAQNERSVRIAALKVLNGLRRIRPATPIVLATGQLDDPHKKMLDLDGTPPAAGKPPLVPQFCSSPTPVFDVRTQDNGFTQYCLASDEVGLRSAVDLVMANQQVSDAPRYAFVPAHKYGGGAYVVQVPARRAVLDLFVHQDVCPGAWPLLWVYDTTDQGVVRTFDDPTRQHNRLQVHEVVEPLERGIAGARLSYVPQYVEMLTHVCGKLGWNAADFRGFRLEVDYPVYGAQYMLALPLPQPPDHLRTRPLS